eukprot:scaffold18654_cov42-Cyclotella_meneghiniana.AAC.4
MAKIGECSRRSGYLGTFCCSTTPQYTVTVLSNSQPNHVIRGHYWLLDEALQNQQHATANGYGHYE